MCSHFRGVHVLPPPTRISSVISHLCVTRENLQPQGSGKGSWPSWPLIDGMFMVLQIVPNVNKHSTEKTYARSRIY